MDEQHFSYQLDPEIIRLTGFKGRQLAGKYGFAEYDAEDIQQDLLLDYLQRSRAFDARRCSRRTFARLVVNNRVATIIAVRGAARRGYRVRQLSLDELTDGENPTSQEVVETLVDPTSRPLEATLNLRLDVERALARLPTAQLALCRLLMVCDTSAEAAARGGMSRATLYRNIERVRAVFAQAGLHS